MQLDTDEQLVGLVQTVLQRLANDAVNQERFLHQEFPDDIHQLFNRVVRRAYEKFKLDDDIDAFTFWGILESVMMHDYDKRIATHDAVSARGLLKAISFNLQLETTPKLVLVPLRKTTIENPIALAPMFLIPPQSDEVTFVKTLESLGLKAAPIEKVSFSTWSEPQATTSPIDRSCLWRPRGTSTNSRTSFKTDSFNDFSRYLGSLCGSSPSTAKRPTWNSFRLKFRSGCTRGSFLT